MPVVPGVPGHSLLCEVEVGLSFKSNRTISFLVLSMHCCVIHSILMAGF